MLALASATDLQRVRDSPCHLLMKMLAGTAKQHLHVSWDEYHLGTCCSRNGPAPPVEHVKRAQSRQASPQAPCVRNSGARRHREAVAGVLG